MLGQPVPIRLLVALMLTAVTASASSAVAAEAPSPNDLKSEIEALKADNATVRELLRQMGEQQRALLEQVDRLQRSLDGVTTAAVPPGGQPQVGDVPGPSADPVNPTVPPTNAATAAAQPVPV